jgi:hypothetical protein
MNCGFAIFDRPPALSSNFAILRILSRTPGMRENVHRHPDDAIDNAFRREALREPMTPHTNSMRPSS